MIYFVTQKSVISSINEGGMKQLICHNLYNVSMQTGHSKIIKFDWNLVGYTIVFSFLNMLNLTYSLLTVLSSTLQQLHIKNI